MLTKSNIEPELGALIDERPVEEKVRDYLFEETVGASIDDPRWVEKDKKEWRKFPIFDQNGSGSCVAQTVSKLLGIMMYLKEGVFVPFSATHIYQRRRNRPSDGMIATDAWDIARDGVTLRVLAPSDDMSDTQMDQYVIEQYKEDVGDIFSVPNYVALPTANIDVIASTIQKTGKGVMVWFYFKSSEWKRDVPEVRYDDLTISAAARHSVTAVDYTMYKGKKALIIEDSWGVDTGIDGQRIITEDFFRERNWYAAYPINFAFIEGSDLKPRHTFTVPLTFSPTYHENRDVKALQDILKYEGVFPVNIESTGYYGAITASAVYDFQKKYQVASDAELDSLMGRRVGGKTIAKLNELYGV